jgi:Ca2+/Na+ antiporter
MVLYVFMLTKKNLSRIEGLLLIGGYIAFVTWTYAAGG